MAVGYPALRQQLVAQFAGLSQAERLLWLNNFLFIVTPDLRQLNDKIAQVRAYRSLGQQRNFLLGGASGMGKTTYMDWLALHEWPSVEAEHNHVPIIKIDASVSNHTPKPLFQRILLECGAVYAASDNEEVLLMKLVLYFQGCGGWRCTGTGSATRGLAVEQLARGSRDFAVASTRIQNSSACAVCRGNKPGSRGFRHVDRDAD